MKEQNFSNHSRMVPLYHFFLYLCIFALIGLSALTLYRHWQLKWGLMIPGLLLLGGVCIFLTAYFTRSFALRAQDRAIRAEENLRFFAITGSLPDSRLTIQQMIALRFAPNNELLDLAKTAAEKDLSPKEIKQSIKNWRADTYRV